MLANAEGNTSAQHDSMRCPSRRLPIAISHIRSLLKPLAQLHALLIPSIIPTHPHAGENTPGGGKNNVKSSFLSS